jgi:hypothetical protein
VLSIKKSPNVGVLKEWLEQMQMLTFLLGSTAEQQPINFFLFIS